MRTAAREATWEQSKGRGTETSSCPVPASLDPASLDPANPGEAVILEVDCRMEKFPQSAQYSTEPSRICPLGSITKWRLTRGVPLGSSWS